MAVARDGHLVGVGDGAALSEAILSQSRVVLEGAAGDFDLAVGAVHHSAAVTGRVAFECGTRDGDGAGYGEITRSVVDGTAALVPESLPLKVLLLMVTLPSRLLMAPATLLLPLELLAKVTPSTVSSAPAAL